MNSNLNQPFSLVDSTFTFDEAREVLMSLIQSKLTFHNLKNLRSYEQTGQANFTSEKRIQELEQMRSEILDLIMYARNTGQKLKIKSEINVELIELAEKASLK
jgi:hypothetical protein